VVVPLVGGDRRRRVDAPSAAGRPADGESLAVRVAGRWTGGGGGAAPPPPPPPPAPARAGRRARGPGGGRRGASRAGPRPPAALPFGLCCPRGVAPAAAVWPPRPPPAGPLRVSPLQCVSPVDGQAGALVRHSSRITRSEPLGSGSELPGPGLEFAWSCGGPAP